MTDETKRFRDRFEALFESGGLTNVKFFVSPRVCMTLPEFHADVNRIQDTITAQDFRVVETIDGDAPTRRFDAAF